MPPQIEKRQNRARQVVTYAKENGIIKAAKFFELDKGMISRWRQHTKVSQKLPSQTNELLKNFQEFIIRLRTEKLFQMSNILNMDETPVWFNMPGNFTIDNKGEKTIHIHGTGNEKN
ncbi:pogo transposable element with KRAB domain [Rhizophagus clarus]|uniref:Pogo transposable element with KRAB domain n=1 Tax=Rhizophagus clarus TaxID=94130 RepID=A0A8H3QH21_9GLOM|nr:pogo transposable element with KRAB domain [Rhizophagus clarus]